MKWTKEKPTKPGYYWRSLYADGSPSEIVEVAQPKGLLVQWDPRDEEWNPLDEDALWAGPIPEPKTPADVIAKNTRSITRR